MKGMLDEAEVTSLCYFPGTCLKGLRKITVTCGRIFCLPVVPRTSEKGKVHPRTGQEGP